MPRHIHHTPSTTHTHTHDNTHANTHGKKSVPHMSKKERDKFMIDLSQSIKALALLNKQLATIHDAIVKRELRTEQYYDRHDPADTRHKEFDMHQVKRTGSLADITEAVDIVVPDKEMFRDLEEEIAKAHKMMTLVRKMMSHSQTFPKFLKMPSVGEKAEETTSDRKIKAEIASTPGFHKHVQKGHAQKQTMGKTSDYGTEGFVKQDKAHISAKPHKKKGFHTGH